VESKITFEKGLNVLVGADDAHNSIGKSSVLMLIDFCFGGDDFVVKCSDVIKNVGHIHLDYGFEFEGQEALGFSRNTECPSEVFSSYHREIISVEKFRSFLLEKYYVDGLDISFRDSISGFFRIYQRDNYNEIRPLHARSGDKWINIRKRSLSLIGKYWLIKDVEEKITELNIDKGDIRSIFRSGEVKEILAKQYKLNKSSITDSNDKIKKLKSTIVQHVEDVSDVLAMKDDELKAKKDELNEYKRALIRQISAAESNIDGSAIKTSRDFSVLTEYFPGVDLDRLQTVESFHRGLSSIMKKKLLSEKDILESNLESINESIEEVDLSIKKIVGNNQPAAEALEELMGSDRQLKDMERQNLYHEKAKRVREDIKEKKGSLRDIISESIENMKVVINNGLQKEISIIYSDHDIPPELEFSDLDYKFVVGDDRGTGKGFANMLALDITYLKETALPCVIHDSLLFKNIAVPAIENIFSIYRKLDKQVFVSIDEMSKFSEGFRELVVDHEFMKLDVDRVAFGVKWNKDNVIANK